ncbi:hypothetical protein VIRA109638_16525 [Vibrio rarus]
MKTKFLMIPLALAVLTACNSNEHHSTTPATSAAQSAIKASELKTPVVNTAETNNKAIKTPIVNAPLVKTPEVKTPVVNTTETKVPETKAPETKTPETKTPETKAPETKTPETKTPETKTPETKAQEPQGQTQKVQASEVGVSTENHVVQITDTDTHDRGEIRVVFAEATSVTSIADGKFTVDLHQISIDGNDKNNALSVDLYTQPTGSDKDLFGEIILSGGKTGETAPILYRTTEGTKTKIGEHVLGHDVLLEVSWTNGTYSFKVDDKTDPSKSVSIDGSQLIDSVIKSDPVVAVALKLGSTNETTQDQVILDNFMVYQGLGDNTKLIFGDRFDSTDAGTSLAATDDAWSKYSKYSNEAVVIDVKDVKIPAPVRAPIPPQPEVHPISNTKAIKDGDLADDFESSTLSSHWHAFTFDNSLAKEQSFTITKATAHTGSHSLLIQDYSPSTTTNIALEFKEGEAASSGSVGFSAFIPSTNQDPTYFNLNHYTNAAYLSVEQIGDELYMVGSSSRILITKITRDTWHNIGLKWDDTSHLSVTVDGTAYPDTTNVLTFAIDRGFEKSLPTQFSIQTGTNSGIGNRVYIDNVRSSKLFYYYK